MWLLNRGGRPRRSSPAALTLARVLTTLVRRMRVVPLPVLALLPVIQFPVGPITHMTLREELVIRAIFVAGPWVIIAVNPVVDPAFLMLAASACGAGGGCHHGPNYRSQYKETE